MVDLLNRRLPPATPLEHVMVHQQDVTRLTDELQTLRAAVVRNEGSMPDRVRRLQNHTRRLLDEAAGTTHEPALRSIESMLDCVARGMAAKQEMQSRYRAAG
jgi:hypothetical protein